MLRFFMRDLPECVSFLSRRRLRGQVRRRVLTVVSERALAARLSGDGGVGGRARGSCDPRESGEGDGQGDAELLHEGAFPRTYGAVPYTWNGP